LKDKNCFRLLIEESGKNRHAAMVDRCRPKVAAQLNMGEMKVRFSVWVFVESRRATHGETEPYAIKVSK
jgi:hypothetical protein